MNKNLIKQVFDELFTNQKVKNQFDFGNRLGYGSGYVTTLMKADKPLPMKVQHRLNEVFKVSLTWLTTIKKKMASYVSAITP